MNEHGRPDIIDDIDTLTQDTQDAADAAWWSATGAHTQIGSWPTCSDGYMTAVQVSMGAASSVEISETDPDEDITRIVGDPFVDQISVLRKVRFWVGDNSVATAQVNLGASQLLRHLLDDVRDGRYIASDTEREHARVLLDTPDNLPVIHGSCLITGVGADGGAAPLGENFQGWFTALVDELAQLRASFVAAIVEEVGIPIDQLDGVVIVVSR